MVSSTAWIRTGRSITTNPKVARLNIVTPRLHVKAILIRVHLFLHRVVHREETEGAEKAAKYDKP